MTKTPNAILISLTLLALPGCSMLEFWEDCEIPGQNINNMACYTVFSDPVLFCNGRFEVMYFVFDDSHQDNFNVIPYQVKQNQKKFIYCDARERPLSGSRASTTNQTLMCSYGIDWGDDDHYPDFEIKHSVFIYDVEKSPSHEYFKVNGEVIRPCESSK